jgi:hypothetical protein
MTSNKTIEWLDDAKADDVAKLAVADLERIQADLDEVAKILKRRGAVLHAGLERRYLDAAKAEVKAKGQGTGTAHVHDGQTDVVVTIPKKVEWDQDELANAAETVISWGEKVTDYMKVTYGVTETAFNAWPPLIKKIFQPARTLTPGKPKFEFKKKKKEEAA